MRIIGKLLRLFYHAPLNLTFQSAKSCRLSLFLPIRFSQLLTLSPSLTHTHIHTSTRNDDTLSMGSLVPSNHRVLAVKALLLQGLNCGLTHHTLTHICIYTHLYRTQNDTGSATRRFWSQPHHILH